MTSKPYFKVGDIVKAKSPNSYNDSTLRYLLANRTYVNNLYRFDMICISHPELKSYNMLDIFASVIDELWEVAIPASELATILYSD